MMRGFDAAIGPCECTEEDGIYMWQSCAVHWWDWIENDHWYGFGDEDAARLAWEWGRLVASNNGGSANG